MKKGIHPQWNKEAKVIVNGKPVMTVGSTSDEMNVEIWAGNHPFYTGKEMLVDVDNLVDKFNKKKELAGSKTVVNKKAKLEERKAKSSAAKSKAGLTLKDMLSQIK